MNRPTTADTYRLSARARRTHEQPISYLMAQAVSNPQLISLAAGLVDYDTLPCAEAARLLPPLLAGEAGKKSLQYGTTHGDAALREGLLAHLAALDGVSPEYYGATVDDIIITTGSQQMLFMLTDVLVDPGDIVINAWPSYFVYTGTLETFGARVRSVAMDEYGMAPEALDATLADIEAAGELDRVKIVYICDYHQNPTGLTLSEARRPQVLDIVRRYSAKLDGGRILLLEDSAYRELTYEGDPPRSIKMHDRANEDVALLQTFSKPFAPGLKTGYALLPRDLVDPVMHQKGNHDFGSANLCQRLLGAAMSEGVYARHVEQLRRSYAIKRDAMLAALDEHLPRVTPSASWTHPTGGLYVWVALPREMDTGRQSVLFAQALENGVLYVPGEYCYGPDPTRTPPRNTLRLSFGVPSVQQIHDGIARLARAIRQCD